MCTRSFSRRRVGGHTHLFAEFLSSLTGTYGWSPPLQLVHALRTAAEGHRCLLRRSARPIRLGATVSSFFSGPPYSPCQSLQEDHLSVLLLRIVPPPVAPILIKLATLAGQN